MAGRKGEDYTQSNRSTQYTVIDVETTGLAAHRGDRVIEVGALLLDDSGIISEFHSLIYVKKPISIEAQLVHGIGKEMLKNQPKAAEVFPKLKKFIGDALLVAHNAKFDLGFLSCEFSRLRLDLKNPYVCTLELSRAHFPRLRNHKLETVYRHVSGKRLAGQTHRALDDARMVAEIWREMREK